MYVRRATKDDGENQSRREGHPPRTLERYDFVIILLGTFGAWFFYAADVFLSFGLAILGVVQDGSGASTILREVVSYLLSLIPIEVRR